MPSEKVVIIIPTYNEQYVISETLAALNQVCVNCLDFNMQVLIFDSASTDKTQQIVRDLQNKYMWLHLQTEESKTGLGSAYIKAMTYALQEMKADIIVEFDADLSHQPKYLLPMLEIIKNCDVVLGSRYINGGSIPDDWGIHRKFISILGNQIARVILTQKYKDFTSGFRITRRELLQKALTEKFISKNYAYKLQLLWSLHKNKAKIIEFPIDFVDRTKGQSKLPANSILDSLCVILVLRWWAIKNIIFRGVFKA